MEFDGYGWSLKSMEGVWRVRLEFGGVRVVFGGNGWSLKGMGGVWRVWMEFEGNGW